MAHNLQISLFIYPSFLFPSSISLLTQNPHNLEHLTKCFLNFVRPVN